MFKTIRDAELLPERKTHPQAQFWSYVELGNHWPWFYVVLIQKYRQALHQSYVFAPSIALLKDLLSNSSQTAWIDMVYIVSPSILNGSQDWKMDPLAELVELRTIEDSSAGHQFTTSSGITYTTFSPKTLIRLGPSLTIFSAIEHLGPKL